MVDFLFENSLDIFLFVFYNHRLVSQTYVKTHLKGPLGSGVMLVTRHSLLYYITSHQNKEPKRDCENTSQNVTVETRVSTRAE